MADEIMRELWGVKDELARKFTHDLDALLRICTPRTAIGTHVVDRRAAVKSAIRRIPRGSTDRGSAAGVIQYAAATQNSLPASRGNAPPQIATIPMEVGPGPDVLDVHCNAGSPTPPPSRRSSRGA